MALMRISSLFAIAILATSALVAGGCGSDSKDDKKDKKAPVNKVLAAKEKAVAEAEKRVKKNPKDPAALAELARAYTALASPESAPPGQKPPKNPKNRDELLRKAADTLEDLRRLKPKDEVVINQLATTYMGLGEYDKALPLRRQLSNDNPKDSSAAYAWGLTASAAGKTKEAITAWERFLAITPKSDPRYKNVKQQVAALRKAK